MAKRALLDIGVGKIARKSGLPDLRIIDADLGQARDRVRVCPPGQAGSDFAHPTNSAE